jgi:hypothetical protein
VSAVTGATEIAARVAAVLCWVAAVGYGAPAPLTARYLLVNRELPVIWGFRAYGGGFFERLGIHPFVVLLAAFLLFCAAEAGAGWLLWDARRGGAVLAVALLPVGAVFWLGFALPIPPVIALCRTALIIASWDGLRP